ncbi:MAG: protein kinase [Myxococcales bacterium]|nr:protein kinase [Myxococcales bacterium]
MMNSDFGEYRLLRLLGEGGMAQVWSARRKTAGRALRCAVKVIKPEHAGKAEHREMFLREGQLSMILSGHDNVVSVFDVGEHQGRPYLAMELIDGVTLAELARRVGEPWAVADAVEVVACILRALCHIHDLGESQGIVHRDVTPHNVMVGAHGEVKLMDFGIAQPLDAEPSLDQALGTLSYVPREQVEGDPDARSDLYAAGAVLFELLDGRRFRWHCADEDALFQEIYRDRVPTLRRSDVPPAVLAVLRGLLQPRREQRIPSAAEALRRLEAWEGLRPGTAGVQQLYARTIARAAEDERSGVPRPRSWDEVCPTAEHPSSPAWAAEGRSGKAPTRAHPLAVVAEPDTDEVMAASSSPHESTKPRHRPSAPAWAARPESGSNDDVVVTRVVPAAQSNLELGVDAMERLVTRRHPAARVELDVPLARNSAEIAVTEPQPSRRGPWAAGLGPVEHCVVRPEPGAPMVRRRPWSSSGRAQGSGDAFDRTGSVSPRPRESASMHEVAGDADMVTGEIVIDDDLDEVLEPPQWRADLR